MKAVAVAPAKVIIFGEHFVVNGNSAISMTIELPTTVTAEIYDGSNMIQIESEDLRVKASFTSEGEFKGSGTNTERTLRPILEAANFTLRKLERHRAMGLKLAVRSKAPVGMGLGSSAATAVATVSAISALLGKSLSKEEIFEAAYSLENLVHGRPSGIDQATVTYGGLITYRRGKVESQLQLAKPPSLIIGNTGKTRSTGTLINRVTKLRNENSQEYDRIAAQAQRISENAAEAMTKEDYWKVGALMDENQKLLEIIGVSSPELEKLISAARSAGALGAKLTGGGGGGCMIALVDNDSCLMAVAESIKQAGGEVLKSTFAHHGVSAFIREEVED